jgi:WD40 repeat protein
VHGIRTFGEWQERLEKLVCTGKAEGQIEFVNYKYGYFSVVAFILPFFRWLVVRRFRSELIKLCAETPRARIDLIGHSFGTHIMAWAIAGLPARSKIQIHTIILSGSVLRVDFPWRDLLGTRVKRVVNDCGTEDSVLLLSQFLVLFTGMAGRIGFSGATGGVFRNRYSMFGHGGYFQDALATPSDAYMAEHWLPLLSDEGPIPPFDHRKPSTIGGIVTVLANNAEPIKIILYASPFAALAWVYFGLYQNAVEERNRALITQSRFLADQANQAVRLADANTGSLLALAALPDRQARAERPYVGQAEAALLLSRQAAREYGVLGHAARVTWAEFDAKGERVVTASLDGTAAVWQVETGKRVATLSGHTGPVLHAAFSPDGRLIATASFDGTVRIWDPASGEQIATLRTAEPQFWSAIFSADGQRLVTVSSTTRRHILGEEGAFLQYHRHARGAAAFSPDGTMVAAAASDMSKRLWDTRAWTEIAALFTQTDSNGTISAMVWDARTGRATTSIYDHATVTAVSFSPDGHRLITASADRTARIWEADTGKPIVPLEGHQDWLHTAVFSPNGRLIVTASGPSPLSTAKETAARLWNAETGAPLFTLSGHEGGIASAAFSPDGSLVLTSSDDGMARLWSTAKGTELAVLAGHQAMILGAVFAPTGPRIVTTSGDHTARLWQLRAGSEIADLDLNSYAEGKTRFSGDGHFAITRFQYQPKYDDQSGLWFTDAQEAAAERYHTAYVWDTENGRRIATLHEKGVVSVGLSSDARCAVTLSEGGKAGHVWAVRSGTAIAPLKGQEHISRNAFDAAGRRVVTSSSDAATVWDCDSGHAVATLGPMPGLEVHSAMMSPDGRHVATSDGKTVRLWDAGKGDLVAALPKHADEIEWIVFATRGMIATASKDKTTRISDVETGSEIAVLSQEDWPSHVAFSADGRHVVTASIDGKARIFEARSGKRVGTLSGDGQSIASAAFSNDGMRIVTAPWQNHFGNESPMVRVLSAGTGELIAAYPAPKEGGGGAMFSADDRRILGFSVYERASVWRHYPAVQDVVDQAKRVVPRCLTRGQLEKAFLDPAPPDWCVDLAKWPYDEAKWKRWLADRRAGRNALLPVSRD